MENLIDKIKKILIIIGAIVVLSIVVTVILPAFLTIVMILAGILIIITCMYILVYYFKFKKVIDEIENVSEKINDISLENEKRNSNDDTVIIIEKENKK
ncbi:MAG: hypothetical protein HG467_002100 [Clostridiales bacterium]|nr:hypothetical protein [Clostridiales bacterium]